MNRSVTQTQRPPIHQRVLYRLVVLFFYALLVLCLSTATLVVIKRQSPTRMIALVPSSHVAWVTSASPTLREGRI